MKEKQYNNIPQQPTVPPMPTEKIEHFKTMEAMPQMPQGCERNKDKELINEFLITLKEKILYCLENKKEIDETIVYLYNRIIRGE